MRSRTEGRRWKIPSSFLRLLGPGLVTGAADDDPSGIATYSQAGAQFGYALCWTMFLTLPFMAAIQIISATIGWRTRRGLAHNLAEHVPSPVLYGLVALLVLANTINIAADLAAMAEVFIPYHRYAGYLKFLTLVLLVYVGSAFSVEVPWNRVLASTLAPVLLPDRDYLLTIVAVFGTTISPYLFFWQASQEAEESQLSYRNALGNGDMSADHSFAHISLDTWVGMVFSNLIAFFIIVTTATTLNAHGITRVETAAQAAEALRPIAGELTFALFALGIIGTGLLAVPVLAGSAAYAVAEAFGLQGSLELPASRALGFYGIVGAATLGGAALSVTRIDPIAMLFWSAVINGIVAVPIMAAVMLVVSNGGARQKFALPAWLVVLGWLASALMLAAVGFFLVFALKGSQ